MWSNSWSTSPPRGESQSRLVSIDETEEEEEEKEATVEIRLFVSPARSISGERRKDLLRNRKRERRRIKALANGYIVRVYLYYTRVAIYICIF